MPIILDTPDAHGGVHVFEHLTHTPLYDSEHWTTVIGQPRTGRLTMRGIIGLWQRSSHQIVWVVERAVPDLHISQNHNLQQLFAALHPVLEKTADAPIEVARDAIAAYVLRWNRPSAG